MNIAIIGTRGIPNHYGGFEQFAEYFSIELVKSGHNVTVYNPHTHPYQQDTWKDVNIIHCKDLEHKTGTAGQFIYDLNCILDTRKRNYDIILQLGYTSSAIWGWLLPKHKSIITTNMDGMEWKRSKYSKWVQKFLLYAERLAVKYSDYLIADAVDMQKYIYQKYKANATYLSYAAIPFYMPNESVLDKYQLKKYNYNMLVARLEPENNIETILDGTCLLTNNLPFLVIGNYRTKYGNYLKKRYVEYSHIHFIDGIYDMTILNNLRYYSNIYFHGHSIGGTNPSLLEAMASQCLIVAHDNVFNKSILEDNAYYFSNVTEIANLLGVIERHDETKKINNNLMKIEQEYTWGYVTRNYLKHFEHIIAERNKNGHKITKPLFQGVEN